MDAPPSVTVDGLQQAGIVSEAFSSPSNRTSVTFAADTHSTEISGLTANPPSTPYPTLDPPGTPLGASPELSPSADDTPQKGATHGGDQQRPAAVSPGTVERLTIESIDAATAALVFPPAHRSAAFSLGETNPLTAVSPVMSDVPQNAAAATEVAMMASMQGADEMTPPPAQLPVVDEAAAGPSEIASGMLPEDNVSPPCLLTSHVHEFTEG